MSRCRLSRWFTIVVAVLVFSGSTTVGQESESGAIPGFQIDTGPARAIPAGVDDAFQPIADPSETGMASANVRDSHGEAEPEQEPIALWEQLAALDPQQRSNAIIELELNRDAGETDHATADTIGSLWNGGAYEPAIELLRALEDTGLPMGLGIAWKIPPRFGGRVLDVRIGDTRTEAQTMSLDFDAQNGNIFAVVRWGSTTGTSAWTMNRSTDGGITWSETYAWASATGIIDVDGIVVGDYIYVAYVAGGATSNEGRMRRCLVSTGGVDTGYAFQTVVAAGTNTVEEVALASNADDYDNRIYYLAIQSNDVLRYFWDVASDGTTFTDGGSPATANAEFGLDASYDYNEPDGTCADFLYVSYAGNDGNIHVLGKDEASWTDWIVEDAAGGFRRTAISSYENSILCAFEYPYTNGTGIRYRISYDCGDSWSVGSLAIPDGTTVFGYFEPDVDARNGNGTAIIYQAEAGELDPMYYRTRAGFAPGAWSDPALFSDHDVYTGSETAMSYLPPRSGEAFSHGAMYLSLDPDFRTLYFDRPGSGSGPCDDDTPPIVEVDQPATLSCACDLVDITGSVDDPDGTYAGDRLEVRRQGEATWTIADSQRGARSGVLYTWDTSALPQDYYYIRVVGENECALSASDSTFVYKSTTFGNLDLRAPVDGGVYGGTVCVDGTAWSQSCFDHYTVDYRTAGVGAYAPVDPVSSPYLSTVLNDPLASWDTGSGPAAVPDGDYDVRLQGVTDCGGVETQVHTITVDNTPPDAVISDPAACHFVTGMVEVFGTADDTNLSSWALQYTGDEVSGWVTINSDTVPVADGLLGRWDTTALPACAYTLRVVVTDMANVSCSGDVHRSEYLVSVNVGAGADCPEDIDGDGDIDLSDLAALLAVYGQTCP